MCKQASEGCVGVDMDVAGRQVFASADRHACSGVLLV
jgi:hypothetical protein